MTLPPLTEAAIADILERSAVQSGTPFESRPGRRRRGRSGAQRALPSVRSPARRARHRRSAAGVAAPLPPQRRARGAAGAVAGGRVPRRRAAGSRAARCSRPASADGVSEADLGVPTRRGRNRGAETLAALQSRGLLVAHTRGRKEVFALAHPALREIIEDFAITDRARATIARRALTRRIATGERLRVPELVAIHRHLRGTLTPPERAVVRRGLGGAGDAHRPRASRVAMLVIAALYADSRRAYSLAFEPPDAGGGGARRRAPGPAADGVPELPSQHARRWARSSPTPASRRVASAATPSRASPGAACRGRSTPTPRRARARLAARGAERPAPRPARNRQGAARRSGRRGGAEAGVQRSGGARRDPVGAERDRPRRRRRGRDPGGRARRRRARDPPARRLGRGGHSPPSGGRDRRRRADDGGAYGRIDARRDAARRARRSVGGRARRGAAGGGDAARRATPPASSRWRCAIPIRRCAAAPRRRPRRSPRASRPRSWPRSPTCCRAAMRARGARRWCCSNRSRRARRPPRAPVLGRVVARRAHARRRARRGADHPAAHRAARRRRCARRWRRRSGRSPRPAFARRRCRCTRVSFRPPRPRRSRATR